MSEIHMGAAKVVVTDSPLPAQPGAEKTYTALCDLHGQVGRAFTGPYAERSAAHDRDVHNRSWCPPNLTLDSWLRAVEQPPRRKSWWCGTN